VAAQVHLHPGGEPAQAEALAPRGDEGGLREVHLRGYGLHPGRLGLLLENAHRGRVAGKGVVGEGVYLPEQHGHGVDLAGFVPVAVEPGALAESRVLRASFPFISVVRGAPLICG